MFSVRKLLFILAPVVISAIFILAVYFFFIKDSGKGALQVTSEPESSVYLDGKLIGQTPLCKCDANTMLDAKEYTIRLIPLGGNYSPFENKITINKSVLTAMDRTFGEGASGHGSIITLTPLKEKNKLALLVLSFPDKASVFLDNSLIGITPLSFKNITASDHELRLEKEGYESKIVRIKTVNNYTHSSTVFLGIKPDLGQDLKITPTATPSASMTPTIASSKVTILSTPTGFLRVRSDSSVTSDEISRVTPGDSFDLISEKEGWYQIKLKDGKMGWISSQYAQKQ